MKRSKVQIVLSFIIFSILIIPIISSCGKGSKEDSDELDEILEDARLEVKRNYFKPGFTLFGEFASAFPEHELREIPLDTPEGEKIFTYQYLSPEMISALDVDEPVTEYPEGAGIFEGDILFDVVTEPFGPGYPYEPEEDLLSDVQVQGKEGQGLEVQPGGAGVSGWKRLWPKREVPFVIAPVAEEKNLFDIMDAITMWSKAGIKFRHKKPSDGNRYIYFMKTSSLYQGSSDSIGMRTDNIPTTIKIGYGVGAGLIAHEIGHALGLFHEQSRADRDQKVVIKWDNIKDDNKKDYCKYDGTGHATYCTMGDRKGQDMGAYEYSSIMHYGSYHFGKVSGAKVVGSGILCGALPFLPSCYEAESWTMLTMHKNDPNETVIVANRTKPTQQDIAAVKELYKFADKCGGTLGNVYGDVKFGGVNTFTHDINQCTNRSYTAFTKDYMNLSITIDSLNFDIPANDFIVDLETVAANGKGVNIITAQNPGGDLKQLVINYKLLPGSHKLKVTNWLFDKINYKMSFQFTPRKLLPDSFDQKNIGNGFSNAIVEFGTMAHTPLIANFVSNLTIHNPGDVDIFVAELPDLPSWNIENYCGTGKGPNSTTLFDGYFEVKITRHDSNRILRTVIYKNDSMGNPIVDPTKGFRPWGYEKKGMQVACPYDYFPNKKIYFSVEDCSDTNGNLKVDQVTGKCTKSKNHFYEVMATFRFTEESKHPLPFNKPEYYPPGFGDDIPFPDDLTPMGLEFIINQGQSFIDLVPQHLKERYDLEHFIDPANEMTLNDMATDSLNQQYEQHFSDTNDGMENFNTQ